MWSIYMGIAQIAFDPPSPLNGKCHEKFPFTFWNPSLSIWERKIIPYTTMMLMRIHLVAIMMIKISLMQTENNLGRRVIVLLIHQYNTTLNNTYTYSILYCSSIKTPNPTVGNRWTQETGKRRYVHMMELMILKNGIKFQFKCYICVDRPSNPSIIQSCISLIKS